MQINREGLEPRFITLSNGQQVALFPDNTLDYIKVDFTFDAGAFRQPKKLVAGAANKLFSEGSLHHSAQEIAEFIDFRGIILDKSSDFWGTEIGVYMLRKYASDMLPLLYEMITEPLFSQKEFDVYVAKSRNQLAANVKKTKYMARNLFYEGVYGKNHPLGYYATPDDFDRLTLQDVKSFYHGNYALSQSRIIISGGFDDEVLRVFDSIFGKHHDAAVQAWNYGTDHIAKTNHSHEPINMKIEGSVQNTIRLGSVLPFDWNSMDYSRFMILNTILGGYFGSRLMSNIREDKGYTYGIYSQTMLQRDSICFFLSADVGSEVCNLAMNEVYKEMDRLCQERVSQAELDRVKKFMEGDFLRSIDGIFECAERYRSMLLTAIDESFTDNYFEALRSTTPEQIQLLAQRIFNKEKLLQVVVGQV